MQKLSNEFATALNRLKVTKLELDNETKKLEDLQRQFDNSEMEFDEMARNRMENNDDLIKIHKEIMEQNSKVERARRELQIAKKAMMKKVGDREYVRLLEVRSLWGDDLFFNFIQFFIEFIERFNDKRARESQYGCFTSIGGYYRNDAWNEFAHNKTIVRKRHRDSG